MHYQKLPKVGYLIQSRSANNLLFQGRTTITIAHRLSTIRHSDKIYVMTGGKVVEEGSHDELINLNGVYYRLVEAQGLKKQIGGNITPGVAISTSNAQSSPKKHEDPEKDSGSEIYLDDEQPSDVSVLKGKDGKVKSHSILYLIRRMGVIAKDQWLKYVVGIIASLSKKDSQLNCAIKDSLFTCFPVVGLIYPAFGIVYAASLDGFSDTDPHVRRFQGDRNALW